jgi:hypothetical protein
MLGNEVEISWAVVKDLISDRLASGDDPGSCDLRPAGAENV